MVLWTAHEGRAAAIDDALFVAEYAIEGCISGITAILKLGSFVLSRPLGGAAAFASISILAHGAWVQANPASVGLCPRTFSPVVKASPQLRQTGLNRPQPSLEAVQAGGKVPARLQSFLANM